MLTLDNEQVEIMASEVDIQSEDVPGWMVATKSSLTVALDVTISSETGAGRKCPGAR